MNLGLPHGEGDDLESRRDGFDSRKLHHFWLKEKGGTLTDISFFDDLESQDNYITFFE